jgi:hypothetical protein
MFVVDKMVEEERSTTRQDMLTSVIKLPDGSEMTVGPFAHDAYSVFEDLCLLVNGERPNFLKLEFLHKTFALELIESVLTNYHELFLKARSRSRSFLLEHSSYIHYRNLNSLSSSNTISALSFSKRSPTDLCSLSRCDVREWCSCY